MKKPAPTETFAIALQVWDGDIAQAEKLLTLICDIEPERRSDIEFIIPAKRGTEPGAVENLRRIALTKFASVTVIFGKRFGTGWPCGPNDLWQDGMRQMSQMAKTGKLKSDAVLTFEPDCLPLQRDWIDRLRAEWQRAREEGKLCIGHAHSWLNEKTGVMDPPTHINGNAIFSLDLLRQFPEVAMSGMRAGWDVEHGKLLLEHGLDTDEIFQLYRLKEALTVKDLRAMRKGAIRPALFHGAKHSASIDAARELLFEKTKEDSLLGLEPVGNPEGIPEEVKRDQKADRRSEERGNGADRHGAGNKAEDDQAA